MMSARAALDANGLRIKILLRRLYQMTRRKAARLRLRPPQGGAGLEPASAFNGQGLPPFGIPAAVAAPASPYENNIPVVATTMASGA
jgi:hypothetical protein